MILRNQVEWALHCCTVLAAQPPEKYVPTKDLAEFHGVPKEYLSKALQSLAAAGILEGTLGPTGGYRLSRSPEKISFLDVVEAIEGKKNTFACTSIINNNPCLKRGEKITGTCDVAQIMYKADEAWREELRHVSIGKLADKLKKKLSAEMQKNNVEWFNKK